MKNLILKVLMLDDNTIKKNKKLNTWFCYICCVCTIVFSIFLYFYTTNTVNSTKTEMKTIADDFVLCLEGDKSLNPEYIDSTKNLLLETTEVLSSCCKAISALFFLIGISFGYQGFFYHKLGKLLTET